MEYKVIDNKAKHTLMFIHGYGSDLNFIKELPEFENHFNIITYTYEPNEKANVEQMYETAKIILNRIKSSKVTIVAHSLGGAIAARLANHKKVQRAVFVAALHPFISKSASYKMLGKVVAPETMVANLIGTVVKTVAAKKNPGVDKFINPESTWYPIVKDSVLKQEFLEELDEKYRKIHKPMFFIVGDEDNVISTKYFLEYVNSLEQVVKVVSSKHNPFENPETYEWLNEITPNHKRLFPKFRKIFK